MADNPERIPLQPIQSSNLEALGYHAEKSILAVQFKSGAIFHYAGVPLPLALELDAAESKGKFYAQHIKGKFTGALMTGECPKCGDKPGWSGETCTSCGTAVYVVPEMKPKEQHTGV